MNATKNKQTTWRKVKLGEVAEVQWGDTNTTKAAYKPIGHLAFSATGPDGYMDHYDFDRDGVVLSAIGANCGETWFVRRKWSAIKNTIVFWGKSGKADTKFLFYKTHNRKLWPIRGSAQPFISQGDAREMELFIPENPTDQKRIADILSAFDEKIEVNNKISRTLEQMAQAIFKEWFVDFRFPGHEKVKMVDSELGKIPEGWEVSNVGAVADNHDGKRIPLSSLERSKRKGDIPYYGANGILDYVDEPIFSGEYVLFAEDGTVKTEKSTPVIFLVNEAFWANNHTHVISSNKVSTYFLYLALRNIHVDSYITGGVQPKITQQNLNSIPVLIPSLDIQREFENVAQPIKKKLQLISKENQKLAALRDLLLPKLMSGEVKV